jgi:uncharacterized protein YjbJ (UPF0337 family)
MSMDAAKRRIAKDEKTVANSSEADKAKGHANELIGTVKQKVGHVLGDEHLEAEGLAQNAEGKKDRLKGEIKEKIEDAEAVAKAGLDLIKEKLQNR